MKAPSHRAATVEDPCRGGTFGLAGQSCGVESPDVSSQGNSPDGADEKRMRLRYAGVCRRCGLRLRAGTTAVYDRASRTVRCTACPAATESTSTAVTAVQGVTRTPSSVDSPMLQITLRQAVRSGSTTACPVRNAS